MDISFLSPVMNTQYYIHLPAFGDIKKFQGKGSMQKWKVIVRLRKSSNIPGWYIQCPTNIKDGCIKSDSIGFSSMNEMVEALDKIMPQFETLKNEKTKSPKTPRVKKERSTEIIKYTVSYFGKEINVIFDKINKKEMYVYNNSKYTSFGDIITAEAKIENINSLWG